MINPCTKPGSYPTYGRIRGSISLVTKDIGTHRSSTKRNLFKNPIGWSEMNYTSSMSLTTNIIE